GKLEQEDLDIKPELIELHDGERRKIGPFDCEFLPVTHSTPSGLITAFHTPQGIILHSSDFKLDLTPVDGRRTNLSRIGALGDGPGVRLLLCDSTNADQPGQSTSETSVGAVIAQLVHENAEQRLIFGAFSSHIHRLQQIADAVVPHGRIVIPIGRSMLRNFTLARQLGMLRIPDANVGTESDIARSEPHEICVVCTGSQAEPRAALTMMASGDSKYLEFGPTDTVVFSSHPIPGNEAAVSRLRSNIMRTGAHVVHSGHVDVHTTGHGKQHELRTLHSVAAPQWFVPVHGEYEHLVAHVEVAKSLMPENRIVFAQDGEQVVLDDDGVRLTDEQVPAGHVYTDGHIGYLDGSVIHERRILRDGGFVAVFAVVDIENGTVVSGPSVESRGWVDAQGEHLESELADEAFEAVVAGLDEGITDLDELERLVRRAVGRTVNGLTGRRPMIVPRLVRY
ncbi:MAG: ribonuclease J, partial [Acidimicrobiales bacterium]|nr:ribonuclease J [Acidimicrobiales bacterium]